METRWDMLTPPEFEKLAREHKICVVPIGSLERHGEHLPFGTDGLTAHAVAVGASKLEPCVVFPPYWFGQIHEAACFSGAVNLPTRLCLEMLEVLFDQIAHNGFEKIIVLNGHGGNNGMLDYFMMSQIDRKVDYTLYITTGRGKHSEAAAGVFETSGGHACEFETSMVMAAIPGSVRMEYQRFEEPITPKHDMSHLDGVRTAWWWYAMYPEQVAGCPSKASIEKGQKALDAAVLDMAEKIKAVKADTVVPALQKEFYTRLPQ